MSEKKVQEIPNSETSEMMVLGCMLTSINDLKIAAEKLDEPDFFFTKPKIIFDVLKTTYKSGKPSDTHLVCEELKRLDKLKDAGGAAYITTLAHYVGTSAYIDEYVDVVKGKATLRRWLEHNKKQYEDILKPGANLSKILEESESFHREIERCKPQNNEIIRIKEIVDGTKSQIDNRPFIEKVSERHEFYKKNDTPFISGISTGFIDLDKQALILEDTNLIIVAARPAMGKTAIALNIASYACFEKQIPVGIISLEMGRDQLLERFISMKTRISGEKIKRGVLTDEELKKISKESENISDNPLFIIDRGCSTIAQVVSIARRLKESKKIGLLIVDYLQLLGTSGSADNRQYEVAEISRTLKVLAMELKIPILCVAQLSRKVEERTDKRPLISDLRDSGQIEQDADAVLFIHRRSYYDKNDKPGEAELLLRKNRNGPEAEVKLHFDKDCGAFSNLSSFSQKGDFCL